jgi:hypothetical protein
VSDASTAYEVEVASREAVPKPVGDVALLENDDAAGETSDWSTDIEEDAVEFPTCSSIMRAAPFIMGLSEALEIH